MQSTSLTSLAEELLAHARDSTKGRASVTVYQGAGLTQRLIALAAGTHVGEHDGEGEATLHVLQGHVRLHSVDRQVWVGRQGDHVIIPAERHDLSALEDAVVVVSSVVPRKG